MTDFGHGGTPSASTGGGGGRRNSLRGPSIALEGDGDASANRRRGGARRRAPAPDAGGRRPTPPPRTDERLALRLRDDSPFAGQGRGPAHLIRGGALHHGELTDRRGGLEGPLRHEDAQC